MITRVIIIPSESKLFLRWSKVCTRHFSSAILKSAPGEMSVASPPPPPPAVQGHSEGISDKVVRWMDVTGFLTRWNNRKEWVLDLEPNTRLSAVVMTEWERKLTLFISFHAYLFMAVSLILVAHAVGHTNSKPPCPLPPPYPFLDHRLQGDFSWFGSLFFKFPKNRCGHCRPLDHACKKECFNQLKAEGHKFILPYGDRPRNKLEPPHHGEDGH